MLEKNLNGSSRPRKRKSMGKRFGTTFENVVFIALLFVFLIAMFKSLHAHAQTEMPSARENGENTVVSSDGDDGSGSGSGSGSETTGETPDVKDGDGNSPGTTEPEIIETTVTTETTITTTEEPTTQKQEIVDFSKIVKIGLIYEHEEHLPIFEEAMAHLNASRPFGMSYKVVQKFWAKKTSEALKLVMNMCKMMDELTSSELTSPDVMIDFTESGIASEGGKLLMKILKIPTVATAVGLTEDIREWRNLTENEKNYLVRVLPPKDIIDQGARALIQLQNISNAAILFETDHEISHKFKAILKDVPTFHKIGNLEQKPTSITRQLNKIFEANYTNIFVIAGSDTISKVFNLPVIYEQRKPMSFFIISMDSDFKFKCEKCTKTNKFTFVTMTAEPPRVKSESIETIDDQFYYDLTLDAAKAVANLKSTNEWPERLERIPCLNYDLKLKDSYPNRTVDLFSSLKSQQGDSMKSEETSRHGKYNWQGQYHYHFSMNIRKVGEEEAEDEKLGKWAAGFAGVENIKLEGHTNLELYAAPLVVKVVTVVSPPLVYKKKNCDEVKLQRKEKNPWAHCFYGQSIDMLDAVAKDLKFNYTIYDVTTYGYMSQLGEWDGIMGEVKNRAADIGIGAISLMPEREVAVDFTDPIGRPVGFTFIMRKPIVNEAMFQFMTVLENDVWWCILAAYFFTTFLLFIFDRYSPSSYQNNRTQYETEGCSRLFTIKECLWFCYSSMTPQGGGEAPKGLSGRLVASTWWLFSFIIIASYVANLAAFLTVSRLAKPISSLDDLINQHRVLYFPVMHSSTWYYFDRLAHVEQLFYEHWRDLSLDDDLSDYNRSLLAVWNYPISDKYTKMWQALVENQPPDTVSEAIDRVVYGNLSNPHQKFAYIGEETDLKYATLIHCNIKIVGETFSHRSYAWVVQKKSPLREKINKALMKMVKNRELDDFHARWWKNNPHDKKCGKWYEVADGINFGNLSGVFLVSGCGIIAAFLTVIIEVIVCRCGNRTQQLSDTTSMAGDSMAGDYDSNLNSRPGSMMYDDSLTEERKQSMADDVSVNEEPSRGFGSFLSRFFGPSR